MGTFGTIVNYVVRDILRSRMLAGYTLFFLLVTEAFLRFTGGVSALISFSNVALTIVPLVSISFGTIHSYNQQPFHVLLLSQPISRKSLFAAVYTGVTVSLCAAFVIGVLLPFSFRGGAGVPMAALATTVVSGVVLTLVFVGIAMAISIAVEDRTKGFAMAILAWLLMAVFYDGLVLVLIRMYADYPIESAVVASVLANPIDLARTVQILHFDIAALMGYTGAMLHDFLVSGKGFAWAALSVSLWVGIPWMIARRKFQLKDF